MKRVRRKRNCFNIKYLLIILLIMVIIIGCFLFINNDKKKNLIYDNFEMIITKVDDNIYYMIGAKKDISFEIKADNDFSYEVLDIEDKKIDVSVKEENGKVMINPPSNMYKDGMTYRLKINNGVFGNEKLKDAKEVVFSIKRAASQSNVLKENTKCLNIDDIKIDKDVLKVDSNLNKDDIVAVTSENNIIKIYKISEKIDDNEYKLTVPNLDEVFDEFDYYGMEKIDLSKFNNNLNTYFMDMIRNRLLIDKVYADEKIKINGPIWNNANKRLEYLVEINTNEKDKILDKSFLNYHKSKIEYTIGISALLYRDISFDKFDVALIIDMDINQNVNIDNVDNNFNRLYDRFTDLNNDEDIDVMIDNYNKVNSEKLSFNKELDDSIISTDVNGLYIRIKPELIFDFDGKGSLNTSLSKNIKYISGINKLIGIYGNYDIDSKGKIGSFGDTSIKVGSLINSDIIFMNISDIKAILGTGIDINDKIETDSKDNSEIEKLFSINNKANLYEYDHLNINCKYYRDEWNKEIIDKKTELDKKEKKKEYTLKVEEKDVEDTTKKYSKDEVKEMLKNGFNKLNDKGIFDVVDSTMTVNYKENMAIDVDKNLLIKTYNYDNGQAIYTCSYNYLVDKISCDNYSKAKDYIKSVCDDFYNDYLECEENDECENEDASEWEFLYGSLDKCYYEVFSEKEPSSYKEEFDNVLKEANLTYIDLDVLK